MSPFLSKNEIESLLPAKRPPLNYSHQISNSPPSCPAEVSRQGSRAGSFAWEAQPIGPKWLSRHSLRILRNVQTDFAASLSRRFREYLCTTVSIDCIDLSLKTTEETLSQFCSSNVDAWFSVLSDDKRELLISWQKELVEELLDVMLGGTTSDTTFEKNAQCDSMELNGGKLRLISRLSELALSELCLLAGLNASREEVQLRRPQEWETHLVSAPFMVNVCLECATNSGMKGLLFCSWPIGLLTGAARHENLPFSISEISPREIVVEVTASLGKFPLMLSDLELLNIGDVLMTDLGQNDEIHLATENMPVFSAFMGVHRNRKALRLSRLVSSEESANASQRYSG